MKAIKGHFPVVLIITTYAVQGSSDLESLWYTILICMCGHMKAHFFIFQVTGQSENFIRLFPVNSF